MVAVDLVVGTRAGAASGARWATIWWPCRSKSTHSSLERPSATPEHLAVEAASLGQVVDREGEVEAGAVGHGAQAMAPVKLSSSSS